MSQFRKAALKSDLPEGTGKMIEFEERRVALFNLGGEIYALDDVCPHRGASLGRGRILRGHIVSCPMHNWEFDIRTGNMQMGPGVESFEVKIEGEEIWVKF